MTPTTALIVVGLLIGAWLLARLPTLAPGSADVAIAPVSIVIPARNEALNLPIILDSIALLQPAPLEVIVVDDESTDATAEVALARGCEVIGVGDRPVGWLGKPWACQTGADAAAGAMLLFLDADTEVAPDTLARLTNEHLCRSGLTSVQPYHRARSAVEQLSALPNVVTMMGTGAFAAWPRITPGAAFGPCLFTSATDYRAVGGHAAVQGRVIEDLHLARAYRNSGLPVRCLAGGRTITFRMYPEGFRQLLEGWSKNLAGGAGAADRLAVLGAVMWVMALAAIASRGIGSAADVLLNRPLQDLPTNALLWSAAAGHLAWMLRRIGSFRWWTSVVFPIPLSVFVYIFLRSLALTLIWRRVKWRGREIRLSPGKVQ